MSFLRRAEPGIGTGPVGSMGQHGGVTTRVFVSGYGRVLTVAAAVVAVAIIVGEATTRDLRTLLVAAAFSAAGGLAAWALFWRPRVEVSDGGVLVVNVTRTIEIPWPVFVAAEAGWSLVVTTTQGRWTAWAAPRASATGAALRRGRRRQPDSSAPRAGRERATAEVVAQAITQRHDELVSAGHLDGARRVAEREGIRPAVSWHVATIAGVLALVSLGSVAAAV